MHTVIIHTLRPEIYIINAKLLYLLTRSRKSSYGRVQLIRNMHACLLLWDICFIPSHSLFSFPLMVAHVNRTVREVVYELDHRSSISFSRRKMRKSKRLQPKAITQKMAKAFPFFSHRRLMVPRQEKRACQSFVLKMPRYIYQQHAE